MITEDPTGEISPENNPRINQESVHLKLEIAEIEVKKDIEDPKTVESINLKVSEEDKDNSL